MNSHIELNYALSTLDRLSQVSSLLNNFISTYNRHFNPVSLSVYNEPTQDILLKSFHQSLDMLKEAFEREVNILYSNSAPLREENASESL